jgi:hypothetical protein
MKSTLRIEEALLFLGSIYVFSLTDFAWGWFLVLILTPDVGMLGYLLNTRIGAITYNIFHHRGISVLLLFVGWYWSQDIIWLAGIIHFGHASLDRAFGYGMKYPDSFKHTHLGQLP